VSTDKRQAVSCKERRGILSEGGMPREVFHALAMAFMLMDHMAWTVFPEAEWLHYIGRLAFPMFAFSCAEGFVKTRSRTKYIIRMTIFAVISEVPFDYMVGYEAFFPYAQNVMFTFTIALCMLTAYEAVYGGRLSIWLKILAIGAIFAAGYAAGELLMTDYGGWGVLTVAAFYLCGYIADFRARMVVEVIWMIMVNCWLLPGSGIIVTPAGKIIFPVQGWGILALIPIWLYSGKKALSGKWDTAFKYFGYCFYPLHMLVLSILAGRL
jgi:hypothetical protein